MKRLGPDTVKWLDVLDDGPPTADAMQGLARALFWDGDFSRAANLAEVMVEHHQFVTQSGHVVTERERDDHSSRFYYWLGIRSAMTCTVNGIVERKEKRGLRRANAWRRAH
jgi:hypothetical protein